MIIDADAHIATLTCFDRLSDQEWRKTYIQNNQSFFVSVEEHIDVARRRLRVDRQMINFFGGSIGLNYSVNPSLACELMTVYNDYMIRLVRESGFFDATAWIAAQDPRSAMAEIDRIADQPFFAVFLGDTTPWGSMPEMRAIFQRAHDRHIPLYIHFNMNQDFNTDISINADARLSLIDRVQWHSHSKLDPLEPFLKMLTSLIIGGWLDDMPNLRIILAERGIDWIAPYRDFMINAGLPDPLLYLKKHFWLTTEPEHPGFKQDAELIGWDRLLFATDHGHGGMDEGGRNIPYDYYTIKDLKLTPEQQSLLTNQNYQRLKSR